MVANLVLSAEEGGQQGQQQRRRQCFSRLGIEENGSQDTFLGLV